MPTFTMSELKHILRTSSGESDEISLDAPEAADRTLAELGYDSLAILDVLSWVQREYAVVVPDGEIDHTRTLHEAAEVLNAHLEEVAAR
jgi:minimal PKS acyl carrier protein